MRLGLVIYGRLDTQSGGYLYDRQLVKHLRGCGEEVEIISLPWQGYGRHLLQNGWGSLRRRLHKSKYDLLLQDELNHPSLFLLNHWLRRHVNYPIVPIVHHLRSSERRARWQNRLYARVERYYAESADGYIFNSKTTQAAVFSLLKGERPSIVAYPGADRFPSSKEITKAEILRRAWAPGPLHLLFVGNIIPRKNLHQLLPVLARLEDVDWRLEVVGNMDVDSVYSQSILRQIGELELRDRVRLRGSLTDEALAATYCRGDLMLLPSSYEGFGIVTMEGMAFGLPTVAAGNGASAEIIEHEGNGFLLPANNWQPLGSLLRELAQDRDRLAQLSLAARDQFDRHPTWSESMTAIHLFLKPLAKQAR